MVQHLPYLLFNLALSVACQLICVQVLFRMWLLATASINDSPIYGCFLDASKAFDRVNYSILFDKLLQRNLSPIVLLVFWQEGMCLLVTCTQMSWQTTLKAKLKRRGGKCWAIWYSDQRICVSLGTPKNLMSFLSLMHGVHQGGVLSPILFSYCYIIDATFCVSLRGRVLIATGISTSLVPFITQMTSLYWHPHPLQLFI